VSELVAIAGSAKVPSRSQILLDELGLRALCAGVRCDEIAVRDLPLGQLLLAATDELAIAAARRRVVEACGVVVVAPVYKASFSGLLQSFLELLPPDALAGKTVALFVVGRSAAHAQLIEYALKPVLASLGASSVAPAVYFGEDHFAPAGDGYLLGAEARLELDRAAAELLARLTRWS
jgi:FMN reductase